MARVTYKLGPWMPDTGEYGTDGLWETDGMVRVAGTWVPAPAFAFQTLKDYTTGTLAGVQGLHVHRDDSGTGANVHVFAAYNSGGNTQLLRGTSTNTLSMENARTALSGSAFGYNRFTSYGGEVYTTNLNTSIQYAATTTTDFTDSNTTTSPNTYDPKASFITTIKNHLLIGFVKFSAAPNTTVTDSALDGTLYPSLVMWSATDNPHRFGDPAAIQDAAVLGSDYQLLNDEFGCIQGLVGGDYALIFKTSAIYRMDGPPFSIHPYVYGSGTIFPDSICQFFENVYFWGPSGPTALEGGSATPRPLGRGKVIRALKDVSDPRWYDWWCEDDGTSFAGDTGSLKSTDISACADYENGLITWFISDSVWKSADTDYSRLGIALVYDVQQDEFSAFHTYRKVQSAKSWPGFSGDALGGQVRPRVLKNIVFVGTDKDAPAIYSTSATAQIGETYGIDTSDTSVNSARDETWKMKFTTKYMQFSPDNDPPASTRVLRVRVPLSVYGYDDSATETDFLSQTVITVKVRSKDRPGENYHEETGTWDGSAAWQTFDGWIEINPGVGIEGVWHQIYVEIACGTTSGGAYTTYSRIVNNVHSISEIEIEYAGGEKNPTGYRTS